MTTAQSPITGIDYLSANPEPLPAWLERFNPGDPVDLEEFFASRVVYYPGSGIDGQPVAVFGRTHAAHCFVLADYLVPRTQIERALVPPAQGFRGYRAIARVEIGEAILAPPGWFRHLSPREVHSTEHRSRIIPPYAFLEILERREGCGPEHGADRLAILFVGADGIANYGWLFCQAGQRAPFAMVIQDNGFGGNYSSFGQHGLLRRIAERADRKPPLLMIAERGSVPWDGYQRMPEPLTPFGGKVGCCRFLYRLGQ